MRHFLSHGDLLARLVGFDSTSHRSNLPIADFLADYLDRPGARVERHPSPAGDKVNLVASTGPDVDPESRGGLVLSGHMDVVPAGETGWDGDPFTLADTGEALVGRGAADMKGFLAIAANAFAGAQPDRLARPLVLVFTYDEELGCLGAHHLAETWPAGRTLPASAVIGEPTSLAVVRRHKGHLKLRVLLTGRSAHSGYPHLGESAIEPAARVVTALAELRRELAVERLPGSARFDPVPFPVLNVGAIAGGTAINVVPERCTVDVGIRLLPGMSSAAMVERVRAAVAAAAAPGAWRLELLSDSPPMEVSGDAPVVRGLAAALGEDGGDGDGGSVSFATDAGWLQALGLDCVVWGPGAIEVAHKPNEWIAKAELQTAAERLGRIADHFCLAAGSG